MSTILWVAAMPCLFWAAPIESAPTLKSAGIQRLCVASEHAEAWRQAGFFVQPLDEPREALPAPGIRPRADRASPTRSPWVSTNGSRLLRSPAAKYSYELPAGKAALAAAEAYVYGTDAALKIDPADVENLGKMLAFLDGVAARDMPDVADVAVVDDGSPALTEVLNLLVRRNLPFKLVKEPARGVRLNVKLGSKEYPLVEAADPSALALKIRRQVGDEQRVLRIFGSEVVIGRLTGDASALRLHLLNYGGRDIEGLRVRVRGTYSKGEAFVAGPGRVALEELAATGGFTEFSLSTLATYAVVDLRATR